MQYILVSELSIISIKYLCIHNQVLQKKIIQAAKILENALWNKRIMIKTGKDRRKTILNLIQIAIALLFLRLEARVIWSYNS
ncbi:hypothetical protein NW062_00145 [Mycoplasmopsis cynos]|nr:hypothetical protein NW062_00145 [Mycoplasmopsis cynos]